MLDKERGEDNELCKLIVNVSPFDEIFVEMREKARVTEKLKDVEGKLVALASSAALKTAEGILSAEHTLADAMSSVTIVFEEFDLQCRDLPATKVQSDSVMTGITSILTDLANLTAPVLDRLSDDIQEVEREICQVLEATTATTPPELLPWKSMWEKCPLAIGNAGVKQWLNIVTCICNKVSMVLPGHFAGFLGYLAGSEVLSGLIGATLPLLESIAAEMTDKTQVVGQACKAMAEFQKFYDSKCEVLSLACNCDVLFSCCAVSVYSIPFVCLCKAFDRIDNHMKLWLQSCAESLIAPLKEHVFLQT